jgi:DNA topoisomerase-1
MSYTLLIVESPAKCAKIEKYLGAGYKCVASFGHIRELNGLENIDVENNFEPKFTLMDSKRQQVSKLRSAIAKAKEVMLAADDDREGEAIAWHICKVFELPVETTKRIIFHEVTEPALKQAVSRAGVINMDTVRAQHARKILDVLVGYRISPILWQKISQNTASGLSAGRCQTPALRIIYDNQQAIDASPGRKVYNTTGYFTRKNLPFVLDHNHEDEDKMADFLESSADYDHAYTCNEPRDVSKKPPVPFTTSGLQQSASNELRISPKETMRLCQKLYEGGYITYMRTDSTTYSKVFLESSKKFIEKTYGETYVRGDLDALAERSGDVPGGTAKKSKKKVTGNKVTGNKVTGNKVAAADDAPSGAQEAHEAIRPTDVTVLEVGEDLGAREGKLYLLIRRNTLESCMAPAKYRSVTATLTAPEEHTYRYTSEQVVFPGWKAVAGYEKESPDYAFLQAIKKESVLDYKSIISKVTLKDLKQHYTEAKLVQLLEKQGIGRPSTFSSLVDKIQERNYVKKENVKGKKIRCVDYELTDTELLESESMREFGNEKDKMVLQPLGSLVLEFLIAHFDAMFQYEYTKDMEQCLDRIAKGEKVWHELCGECLEQIDELSEGLVEERITIPIDDSHTYMIAKYGPVIKCVKGDKTTFKKVKADIDVAKLRAGDYKLDEIIEVSQHSCEELGKHKGTQVLLKTGQYGPYVEWGVTKRSVKLDKPLDEITLEDVLPILAEKKNAASIVREIDDHTSVRTGKYGDYVFHKKPTWKKPRFLKLYDFIKLHGKDSYKTCEISVLRQWLAETYSI